MKHLFAYSQELVVISLKLCLPHKIRITHTKPAKFALQIKRELKPGIFARHVTCHYILMNVLNGYHTVQNYTY